MFRWVVISWALLALVGADECPDGGRCEDGQTCCNDLANGYECCPFDQAECCEDHIHCCPADTICETATSSCVNATVSIPWVERASADQPRLSKSFRMIKSYVGDDDDNICPDLSRCPAEFSCLKALTRFGCCPLAQGVSCSDGKHCCPEGHQCSADSRSCVKKDVVTTVICNDGVSECPDETTCCETPEGTWACCPIPKAVCCSDKIHCCPEGTTCDVEHSKCNSLSTNKVLPMWAKLPARMRADWENLKVVEQVTAGTVDDVETEKVPEVTTANQVPPSEEEVSTSSVAKAAAGNNVPCNQTAACPDGSTCCKTKEGEWACCPLPEAVCCEDFVHCCPKGETCNVAAGTCDDGTRSIPWAEKVPSIPRHNVQVKDVPCDDTVGCPDGSTCCKTKEGDWACCPLPEAVCCEDFVHCCPKGEKCNVAEGTCDDGTRSMPWTKKMPSIPRQDVQVKDVPCDDTVGCPDGSTCCKTKEGDWACCPLPEAVCCEDFVHCCPKGETCNVAEGTCDDGTRSIPWAEKVPSIPRHNVQVKDVPCDDTIGCPDGSTCCKTKEGSWACCPLPEAVCCEDFVHCCPKGKKCNVAAGTCDDDTCSVPWAEKVPSIPRHNVQVKDVPCDDTVGCPDGSTCCKTKEGDWACCPLPEAVCCEDFVHCCPKGEKCNVAEGTCDDGTRSMPWTKKMPSIPRQDVQVKDVPCDDTVGCPDGSTCCKTKEGEWACCPLPEAVCCEDFVHCCPKGETCNVAAGTCDDGTRSMPWAEKVPSIPRHNVQVKDVPCDDTVGCPDGSTCCKTKEGEWACCPLPEAVCCEDFVHCCPKGETCNVAAGTCDDGTRSIPWAEKVPSIPRHNVQVKDVPCDDTVGCPDGSTCCKTKEGDWACCPLPEAVCCEDFIHCCPNGEKCNLAEGTCDDGTRSMPWTKKMPSIPRRDVQVKDVPCDDTVGCPDGSTCCKTKEGEWACCPLPEAVCCEDFVHCCPKGEKCNVAEGTCDDGTRSMPWTKKMPSIPRQDVQVKNVKCDDTAACPDGSTCCKNTEDKWACCPLPQAVCCDDHETCCPTGTTCDTATSSCQGPSGSVPMRQKIPAFSTAAPTTASRAQVTEQEDEEKEPEEEEDEEVEGRIQCDSRTSCPQSSTCCFMKASQQWGCCPLPQAVCCADGSHCCPQQYKCNEKTTSCFKGEVEIPWYTKLPAVTSDQSDLSAVRCDGGNQCPEHTTCCRLASGEWGCCPLEHAVCCPDKKHCCPQDFTCNEGSNSCQRLVTLEVEMVPLTPVYLPDQHLPSPLSHGDITCDKKTRCRNGQTCCRTSTSTWGCCSSPNAVCCSDMRHCCPTGTFCTEAGSCIHNPFLHWADWHVYLANKKRALSV